MSLKRKFHHLFLTISSIILGISAIIDAYLYFTINHHVPAIAISLMSSSLAAILLTIKKLLR